METHAAERLRATARNLVALNRFEDAVFFYEQVLENVPDDVETILELAYLYSHVIPGAWRGDALWQRAVAIAPHSIEALFWSAYHAIIDGGSPQDRVEARQRLVRVIELDPCNRSGYVGCAHALLGHLEAAVHASPDAPRFHQRLARAYEGSGRLREALAHFERALAQSRLHAKEPGDSRQRYKADVLEGRSVPRYVLEELRGSVDRVRQRLDAGGCGR